MCMLFGGENNTEVRTFLALITSLEFLDFFRTKATSRLLIPKDSK